MRRDSRDRRAVRLRRGPCRLGPAAGRRAGLPGVFFGVAVTLLMPAATSWGQTDASHPATPPATLMDGAAPSADPDLQLLGDWLAGSFSSAAQAAADTSYFDIRLHVVPIWPDRPDGPWLYVEQATAARLDRPYRQRIYRLARVGGDLFESHVYTLAAPLRFAGAWQKPEVMAALVSLPPDSLEARAGCSIVLRRMKDGSFMGSTLGHDCASELRGATWAASEVTITASGMKSWDRGFDAGGTQAWGAVKGPYIFDRVTER